MKAKSIKGNSSEQISSRLGEVMKDGFMPTLAIVFISAENEREALRSVLSAKGIQIFGASSGSEFIDGEIGTKSIVILLLDLNPAYFHTRLIETGESSTRKIAQQIGKTGMDTFRKPAFIIIS